MLYSGNISCVFGVSDQILGSRTSKMAKKSLFETEHGDFLGSTELDSGNEKVIKSPSCQPKSLFWGVTRPDSSGPYFALFCATLMHFPCTFNATLKNPTTSNSVENTYFSTLGRYRVTVFVHFSFVNCKNMAANRVLPTTDHKVGISGTTR